MTALSERTLASIVTEKHQAAAIFEKYNLDFCCRGKRTLTEACAEKGLQAENIAEEVQQAVTTTTKNQLPFTSMTAEQLVSYILIHHHFYVKQSMPTILAHIERVVTKHADKFPYMTTVLKLFKEIRDEMTSHMQKEELVLFPRIKQVEAFFNAGNIAELPNGFISMPVEMMEAEHEQAGKILDDIRQITNNYTPPENACTTFRVCLAELKEFEEDLHKHVHLENHLLFPLAQKMLTQQTEPASCCVIPR